MLTRPFSIWSVIGVGGLLVLGVFLVLGYALILLPLLAIGLAMGASMLVYSIWTE
jgi:hypothetical protein